LEDAKQRGEELSEDYLRDLVLNFLIAGRDTTAQALSWTIYCLSTHPDVETKVRREIVDICGVRGPSYEDLPRLKYLDAVINEVLRLYPSLPIDSKVALSDDVLPDGTFVPRGTIVDYDIYCMGRDRSIWGEHASMFLPERWLEMKQAPGSFEYPVFNAGPRECLGRKLAMVEAKTCLAMLIPQMSFKLAVPSEQISPDVQLTLGMASGLPCFVTKACARDRMGSNVSTSLQSECETMLSETTMASSESEKGTEPDTDSQACSDSESLHESASACATQSSRKRSKKRQGGWARQRRAKFWRRVRESTPERWPDVYEVAEAATPL